MTRKKSWKSQRKRVREERNNNRTTKEKKTINQMAINTFLSIMTLNVNHLNIPIKRLNAHTCQTPIFMLPIRDSFQT